MAYLFLRNNQYTYTAWDENLSLDEIVLIWTKIFYHYPNIIPYDQWRRSYFY